MPEFAHAPQFNVEKVCEHYVQKEGVPVRYVCTSEIKGNNCPCDVFFRETPHPTFGNRYFALVSRGEGVFIMDADSIEDGEFACIKDKEGKFHYSQFRHDFREVPGAGFIDGGRAYVRCGGNPLPAVTIFNVKNGELVEDTNELTL